MSTTQHRSDRTQPLPVSLAGQVREPGPREPKGTPKGRFGDDTESAEVKTDEEKPKAEPRRDWPQPQ